MHDAHIWDYMLWLAGQPVVAVGDGWVLEELSVW